MLKTDSRRIFRLPTSSHLFAMVTVALIISGFARQCAESGNRPNIIFIMADDKCNSLIGRDSESRKYTVFLPYSGESGISNDRSN